MPTQSQELSLEVRVAHQPTTNAALATARNGRLARFLRDSPVYARLRQWVGFAAPPNFLEEPELMQRLRLNSTELISQIYEVALRVLDGDDKRGTSLDGKATSLLGAVGLSLTVAFTFGGTLVEHPERFSAIGPSTYKVMVVLYALSLLSGLLAGFYAIRSLRIRPHRAIDELDFLRADVLA